MLYAYQTYTTLVHHHFHYKQGSLILKFMKNLHEVSRCSIIYLRSNDILSFIFRRLVNDKTALEKRKTSEYIGCFSFLSHNIHYNTILLFTFVSWFPHTLLSVLNSLHRAVANTRHAMSTILSPDWFPILNLNII